jgi:hypothetical protein
MRFFKGRSANDQKTHEEYLTSLTIKEMQIKTMLRFHLIPVRMAIIKNTTTNAGENAEEWMGKESSSTV